MPSIYLPLITMVQGECMLAAETYPYDIVASTAAFSMRKVRAAYAGPCIRVRRSSDSTEQDIGFNGYVLDCAAVQAFVGAGDGYVTIWYDQSGNGRDVVQAAVGLQPQIMSGGMFYTTIGGYPSIYFSGSRYLESSIAESNYITSTAGTVFALWNADSATAITDGNTIWCNRGGWNGTFIKLIAEVPNIRIFGYDGDEDFITSPGFSTTVSYVTVWKHDSGVLYSYVGDGNAIGSIAHGSETTITAHFCIGRDSQTVASSVPFHGKISEVITYNTALSDANLDSIGSAMSTPFMLTWV